MTLRLAARARGPDLVRMGATLGHDAAALFAFDNSYRRLPDRFHAPVVPAPVRAPRLLKLNRPLARLLGADPDALASPSGVAVLSGSRAAPGSEPIALAYAGHQFGHFVPSLGDGRAVLLGEVVGTDGARRDIHLKGSGRTSFSRGADGRAAVGPVIREYIVSEAMTALGIPSTRTLAAVATGEEVHRETVQPGAVLVRVAASHVRVGTFQYFAARGDTDGVRRLADHVIARHDPSSRAAANPYRALLDAVVRRSAVLVARWMAVGFVHGVMNTDNTAISGETIDYGPCAFLDEYDPGKVFSSIDHAGRYAFGNQPRVMLWNLARFAETLLPLLAAEEDAGVAEAEASLALFGPAFDAARLRSLRLKLGFRTEEAEDGALAADLFGRMAADAVDHTLFFRLLSRLADGGADGGAADGASADGEAIGALFRTEGAFAGWAASWRARLAREGDGAAFGRGAAMRAANPAVVPRNHLVEEAIAAAVSHGDLGPFDRMVERLSRPYEDGGPEDRYALPPTPSERVRQTFCGT